MDKTYAKGRPFSVRLELTRVGALEISLVAATIERYGRTRRCVAAAGNDHLALEVNVGKASMHGTSRQHAAAP